MNNIVKIKRYLTILNEEYPCHKKDAAMEGAIKLFSNLISENKELKEEKDRVGKLYYEANENCIKYEKDYIPKSKVEAKIEEVSNGTYDAKIVLQSLLGKE